MKKINYYLIQYNFFSEGRRGRVSHALGFVNGILENELPIAIYCDKNINSFGYKSKLQYTNKISFYINIFYKIFKNSNDVNVIRWKPLIPFFIYLFPNKRNIWFEVNSFTNINSNNCLYRFLSIVSLTLLKKFNLIFVSDNSKNYYLNNIGIPLSSIVINNGISSCINFHHVRFKRNIDSQINFVYVGKYQNYYDWDDIYLIESVFTNSSFHFFGIESIPIFSEKVNCHFYGQFDDINNVYDLISRMDNQILLLNSARNDIAKFGFPTKVIEYASTQLPILSSSVMKGNFNNIGNFYFYDDKSSLISFKKLILSDSFVVKKNDITKFTWKFLVKKFLSLL